MGEHINIQTEDGRSTSAYYSLPNEQDSKKVSIVINQEIFGVNAHIKEVCDNYARLGYESIAPALFDQVELGVEFGYEKDDVTSGAKLVSQLSYKKTLFDLQAAINYLKRQNADQKIVMIGYCYGGFLSWSGAAKLSGLAGAVVYYGNILQATEQTPKCPVQMHFGKHDQMIPVDKVNAFKERYPNNEIHIYDAGHGFNCDKRADFNQPSADLALERVIEFMSQLS